jgi:hypothetical protein
MKTINSALANFICHVLARFVQELIFLLFIAVVPGNPSPANLLYQKNREANNADQHDERMRIRDRDYFHVAFPNGQLNVKRISLQSDVLFSSSIPFIPSIRVKQPFVVIPVTVILTARRGGGGKSRKGTATRPWRVRTTERQMSYMGCRPQNVGCWMLRSKLHTSSER